MHGPKIILVDSGSGKSSKNIYSDYEISHFC